MDVVVLTEQPEASSDRFIPAFTELQILPRYNKPCVPGKALLKLLRFGGAVHLLDDGGGLVKDNGLGPLGFVKGRQFEECEPRPAF